MLLATTNTLGFTTNGTDKLWITSDGTVIFYGGAIPTINAFSQPFIFRVAGGGLGLSGSYETTSSPIVFYHSGSEQARVTNGNLLVGVTSANANGGVLQLKSGITFPATQVAATDANTLDDYEEGTFTPSLGDSAGGVATMSVQEGKYVKVGKIVQFSFQVVWTAKNTWTATNTKISGLPFAATTNTGGYYWPNPAAMSCNLTTTAFNYAIESGQTFGYIMTLLIGQIDASNFPSSGRAIINGVYQTA
jgi:hypothetical protein